MIFILIHWHVDVSVLIWPWDGVGSVYGPPQVKTSVAPSATAPTTSLTGIFSFHSFIHSYIFRTQIYRDFSIDFLNLFSIMNRLAVKYNLFY